MRQKQIAVITAASMGLAVCVLLAGFGWATPALPGTSGYHILKTIPLPGTEGWDYLTMDSAARILYISRGNHIDAVNVDTGALVGKVTGVELGMLLSFLASRVLGQYETFAPATRDLPGAAAGGRLL